VGSIAVGPRAGLVVAGAGWEGRGSLMALDAGTGATRWSMKAPVRAERSQKPHRPAFYDHGGLVVSDGRVFGQLGEAMVAVDAASGRLLWARPLGSLQSLSHASLAATREHLFGHLDHRLFALRLEDGAPEWEIDLPASGQAQELALADGLLFFTDGTTQHAFAPAERLF